MILEGTTASEYCCHFKLFYVLLCLFFPKYVLNVFTFFIFAMFCSHLFVLSFFVFCSCSAKLAMFSTPNDPVFVDTKRMYSIFRRCEMMEIDMIDWVISYWKDSSEMNYLFQSGERVLLSPNTILVCFF